MGGMENENMNETQPSKLPEADENAMQPGSQDSNELKAQQNQPEHARCHAACGVRRGWRPMG